MIYFLIICLIMSYNAFLSYSLSYSSFSHIHPSSLHTQLWILLFKKKTSKIAYLFLGTWLKLGIGQPSRSHTWKEDVDLQTVRQAKTGTSFSRMLQF